MINWQPLEVQVEFHLRRMQMLADYFAVVFDAAHWWLNVLDHFLTAFPESRVVALRRQRDASIQSFARIKGYGPNSINHWAPPDQTIWSSNLWDPAYPSYPLPTGNIRNSDTVRAGLIGRYLDDYHRTLTKHIHQGPNRFLLLNLEELDEPTTRQRLNDFTGLFLSWPTRPLNAQSIVDSSSKDLGLIA